MANSRYAYVKNFEYTDPLLPHCWIVVRLDGKGFTKFSELHAFEKPNDVRALQLMDAAALVVVKEFGDIRVAYGESDEYSFVLHKDTTLYKRRSSKITSVFVSLFTAAYVSHWPRYFPDVPLRQLPAFDARAICYPTDATLRDYLSWRQVDTHVNNQYNTCFWALRQQGGLSGAEAQAALKGTLTSDKNELLYRRFGINYNDLPERFKKGSIIVRKAERRDAPADGSIVRQKRVPVVLHVDIIRDAFWGEHDDILS